MTTPLQNINSIGQKDEPQGQDEQKSQAQIDYEEGRGYVERGEAALAAVSLHNALRGFEQDGNEEGIANASNQLGHACLIRKEYDKAIVHYERAWRICENLGDELSLLTLARHLVEAQKGLQHYPKAINHCLYLLDRYQKNNNPQGAVEALELMAEVYIAGGERGKAADAYKTAASIHANFKHETIAEQFRQKAAELTEGIE